MHEPKKRIYRLSETSSQIVHEFLYKTGPNRTWSKANSHHFQKLENKPNFYHHLTTYLLSTKSNNYFNSLSIQLSLFILTKDEGDRKLLRPHTLLQILLQVKTIKKLHFDRPPGSSWSVDMPLLRHHHCLFITLIE